LRKQSRLLVRLKVTRHGVRGGCEGNHCVVDNERGEREFATIGGTLGLEEERKNQREKIKKEGRTE
jgi:hypothetical protein